MGALAWRGTPSDALPPPSRAAATASPSLTPPVRLQGGETPLYVASQEGFVEVARVLVDAGADVNAANKVRRDGRVWWNVHVCMWACVHAWVWAVFDDARGLSVRIGCFLGLALAEYIEVILK